MDIVEVAFNDCSADELAAMIDPNNGLAARCSWPPALYDIATFRKQRRDKIAERADFDRRYPKQRRTVRHEEPLDADEVARRKARVKEALGYDPALPKQYQRLPLDKETQAKIDAGDWSIADLKTPPAPPRSRELKALVKAHAQDHATKT